MREEYGEEKEEDERKDDDKKEKIKMKIIYNDKLLEKKKKLH